MPFIVWQLFQIVLVWYTVNVEIFAQYIFSGISRRVLGALKYDVSEKINRYGASRNNCYIRKDLSTRKGHLGPDARKFSSAKISTFTVYIYTSIPEEGNPL